MPIFVFLSVVVCGAEEQYNVKDNALDEEFSELPFVFRLLYLVWKQPTYSAGCSIVYASVAVENYLDEIVRIHIVAPSRACTRRSRALGPELIRCTRKGSSSFRGNITHVPGLKWKPGRFI